MDEVPWWIWAMLSAVFLLLGLTQAIALLGGN